MRGRSPTRWRTARRPRTSSASCAPSRRRSAALGSSRRRRRSSSRSGSASPTSRSSAMPLLRRRRPLLRAAAVGGGAYLAGKHVARNQEAEAYQDQRIDGLESQGQAAPAPGAGGLGPDAIQRLQQLGQLHEQGVLTDDEFTAQKAAVLSG